MNKYGEPWDICEMFPNLIMHELADGKIDFVAQCCSIFNKLGKDMEKDYLFAKRIVSCVNALKGIENPTEFRNQRDELVMALFQLKRGDCWCEAGIGNPMMKGGHSYDCNFAKQALARCKPSATEEK